MQQRFKLESWLVTVVRPRRGSPYIKMPLRDFNRMRRQWEKYRLEHFDLLRALKDVEPANYKFRPI